jgi:nitrate/nitrite-specific signal transduction histidine kinase
MNAEIEEYFYLLREVCRADDSSLGTAYRQLRELLEHLCRTQMTDSTLQMTDLAARINFVSSKLGLTVAEQNRLHTFRLASNAVYSRQRIHVLSPGRANLRRQPVQWDMSGTLSIHLPA